MSFGKFHIPGLIAIVIALTIVEFSRFFRYLAVNFRLGAKIIRENIVLLHRA